MFNQIDTLDRLSRDLDKELNFDDKKGKGKKKGRKKKEDQDQ